MLDQKPVVATDAFVAPSAHQHPPALELLARQSEFQLALAESLFRINPVFWRPQPPVPYHDGAADILSLRDRAFKVPVVERMILNFNRQPPIARGERRPLRHGPGLEDAIGLQPQIIVEPGGSVLLNHKARILGRLDPRFSARPR